MTALHPKVAEAIQQIDAAIFSSDSFHTPENLRLLTLCLGRWTRAVPDMADLAYQYEPTPAPEESPSGAPFRYGAGHNLF